MTIKTYMVAATDSSDDAQVTLRVDLNVLTPELAHEINTFWSLHEWRLSFEGRDVVRAVVRLFGALAIAHFRSDGGASFGPLRPGQDLHHTADVIQAQGEGWPACADLGIQIEAAEVSALSFDDVELREIGGAA